MSAQGNDLFVQVRRDVEKALFEEIKVVTSAYESGKYYDIVPFNGVTLCGKRLANLDETTTKYLMALTNDYLRAKKENEEGSISIDTEIFRKYGFDVTSLDKFVEQIPDRYSANHEVWPTEAQEMALNTVWTFFGCPGKLPTVKEIENITNMFGLNKEKNFVVDTAHLDDPYVGDYFNTALSNGLSVEQIIDARCQLSVYMTYYKAPSIIQTFSYTKKMSQIVPFLNEELIAMSNARAKSTYQVFTDRMISQMNSINNMNQETEQVSRMHR